MQNEPFTPEEQVLINRLKDAPKPSLRPHARDAIRAQLFAELDAPLKPFWKTTAGMMSIGVVTTVIIIVIVIIGISVAGGDDESPTVNPIVPSQTPMIETTTPTVELTITPENTSTATPSPSITSTMEVTAVSPTPQPTPTVAANTGGPIMVIEGPISAINLNTITIFDMTIQVDPNDPILVQLQVGDRVRIDGQTTVEGNTIIIVAVNITIINTQIIVEPSGGLPANCKITRNGRITCKDTRRTTRD